MAFDAAIAEGLRKGAVGGEGVGGLLLRLRAGVPLVSCRCNSRVCASRLWGGRWAARSTGSSGS